MTASQRDALDAMLRNGPRDAARQPIDEMRSDFEGLMANMTVPSGARTAPTTLGGIPALAVEPELEARTGTILYFHGGSWVLGSPRAALGLTTNIVTRTGFTAYSLDYRLAPEHPFPAAIADGLAAYRALLDRGIDASSIAFAGESAGGGLSVTVCLAARAAGLPMPAAVLGFSAGLDATRSGASMASKADADLSLTRGGMDYTGALYLAGQDPHQELLSPAVLADMTGFPPLLLQVGTNEILLDDSTRLAERARDAGVDVVLDVTAGVPHVFQAYVGLLDEADQAMERAALFLTQHLAPGSTSPHPYLP
jgi:monoterpene epsilon-lactone hydrolase